MRGVIRYTARRSLVAGHLEGQSYVLLVDFSEALPSAALVRSQELSDGGNLEVIVDRVDRFWALSFAPAGGYEHRQRQEFLDSTEAGELFRVWPFGDESAPLTLKRVDAGHTESAFMRRGSRNLDLYTASISAIEAAANDQGDTSDIYAREFIGSIRIQAGFLVPDARVGFVVSSFGTLLEYGFQIGTLVELTQYSGVGPPEAFNFQINDLSADPGQLFFSTMEINGTERNASDATYLYLSGTAIWQWEDEFNMHPFVNGGIYTANFYRNLTLD